MQLSPARNFHPCLLLSAGIILLALATPAQPADRASASVPGYALFTNGPLLRVRLQLSKEALASLRKDPRKDVSATVLENGLTFTNVAIHLKGAAGSFRALEDKPAFTLNFGKLAGGQRFHGLRKIHLNNSVQDSSYLNELLAGDLFRAADVPATRVTHALVELNGRKLGLYVLKEGFTKDFLGLYFRNTNGNLYEMDPGREVTERLERDSGDGPDDWSDLKALANAATETDVQKRWTRLAATLDVDRFISFMAMEIITGHWDGYCVGRNNFRIYHDVDTDRMVFFPHGTDQLFGNPSGSIRPRMNGLVAQALLRTPEGRRRYIARVRDLATNVFQAQILTNRINAVVAALQPGLASYKESEARNFANEARGVRDRVVARATELSRLIFEPEPQPLPFTNNIAMLGGWRTKLDQGSALHVQVTEENRVLLKIDARNQACVASWRTRVLLDGGRYKFQGRAKSSGVVAQRSDIGNGAGLRISGGQRKNQLSGNSDWTTLDYELEIPEGGDEVELVCELRAQKGEVYFDAASLQLVRLK